MRRLMCLVCGIGLVIAWSGVGAVQRPFTADDLVCMQRLSGPRVSPDGSRVAFVVTTMDLEANRGRSDIWVAAVDGSGPSRLTTAPEGDWSPRWAGPDQLYFLSSRSGSAQVWRLPMDGGEARPVTDLPLDVGALQVGPGGKALYLSMAVFPECEPSVACTVERLQELERKKTTGRIYDELFVRHWDTWEDGRRNHVFRMPLGDDGLPAGEAVDLMQGVDGDCPTEPWGGSSDWTVSPDDQWVVYTAKVLPGSEEAWSTDWDLWVVPTDGGEAPRCLTEANQAWDTTPVFSPDGKRLAYLAMERPGYESDRLRVVTMAWPDGAPRVLTDGWDRSPSELVWAPDGSTLYAAAQNVGNRSIFSIDAETGRAEAVVMRHSNRNPCPLDDGSIVFRRDSLVAPAELYRRGPEGAVEQLTHLNDERLAELQFGEYEQFTFTGAHGDAVHGYLIRPVGFDSAERYPLAFLVHGGPQGSFDDTWHYRWNAQIYAAHGYATAMIDFHGSTGYGQAFTDAIRGDWGGAPYEDLMTGVDWLLAHHPWIDGERMAALGASFGGFMINWIQGRTDRFDALVCHDGNLDEYMAYFDTEELWFPEWDHEGTPWENPEGYRKHSPVQFVENFSTPELVIHGAKDFRVVETQGLATFNALQRRGVPSRLLYYPDENHWVLKPLNSLQWHEVVLDWIDRWTAPDAGE